MADDNDNGQIEGGSTFGEITKRDYSEDDGSKPVLVEEKVETTEKPEETEEAETATDGSTETKKEEESELTEKGTKLDPNPQSAIHQQFANEHKIRENYEKVLASPELLKKFAKEQYGIEFPQAKTDGSEGTEVPGETIKEFKPEDFESLEDVARVVNGLQKTFGAERLQDKKEIEGLKQTVQSLLHSGKQQNIATNVAQEIRSLQSLPELTKGNSEYIEGLEEEIVKEFERQDGDGNGFYKGEHSLSEIATRFIEIAKKAKKSGSLEAQTIVKDKSKGKIVTSSETKEEIDTDKLDPGDSIALGIAKAFGR